VAYLNCPECFYRVRTAVAEDLDGEASCPRCARLGNLVSMYSTQIALRPSAETQIADAANLRLAMPAEEAPPA
jgi:hypothetical protein